MEKATYANAVSKHTVNADVKPAGANNRLDRLLVKRTSFVTLVTMLKIKAGITEFMEDATITLDKDLNK